MAGFETMIQRFR